MRIVEKKWPDLRPVSFGSAERDRGSGRRRQAEMTQQSPSIIAELQHLERKTASGCGSSWELFI
jgi:hypothetical protein